MKHYGRPIRGFTLVEVLVVVALIALLLAILMPSLAKAREQARQVVCLSNLKQILTATGMYRDANAGWVPFGPAGKISKFQGLNGRWYTGMRSSCLWGGKRGAIHGSTLQNHERPLTGFIYRNMQLDKADLFKCPSDTGTDLWSGHENVPFYETCGNSYYMNIHGQVEDPKRRSRVSDSLIVLYHEGLVSFRLGVYPEGLPWTYVPPDESEPHQGMGWHGEFSRHNVGFVDLHAANIYMDTRELSGSGWNVREFLRIWGFATATPQ
jgi:prepilin-type N-terminal cleavage/methylation domain-containing protein